MSKNETFHSSAEEGTTAGGHGPGFVLGVLLGILAGAAIATLFTPVSGDEVRARTRERAPDLWRRRDEVAAQARERARSTWNRLRGTPEPKGPADRLVARARDVAKTSRSRLQEAWEAGREATREGQDEARRRFETLTGRRR
jgi:gas vesicle protein